MELKVGETLKNGAVVDSFIIRPHKTVVLAYWEGNHHPWVTWRVGEDKSTFWGHYFENREDAEKDLEERI